MMAAGERKFIRLAGDYNEADEISAIEGWEAAI